ncbi:MAG: hypothetical protein AAF456_16150 [Planctomycetota bacterium]
MKKLECRQCDTKFKFVNTAQVTCPKCGRIFDNYFFEPGKTENRAMLMAAVGGIVLLIAAVGYFLFFAGGGGIPDGGDGSRLADKGITQGTETYNSVFGSARPVKATLEGSTLTLEFPMQQQFANSMTRSMTERDCVKLLKQVQGMDEIRELKIIGMLPNEGRQVIPEKGFAIKYLMKDVNKLDLAGSSTNDILWSGDAIWWHSDYGYD